MEVLSHPLICTARTTIKLLWIWVPVALLGGMSVRGADRSASHPPSLPQVTSYTYSFPGAGLVNDWLRRQSPAWTNWDIGGQIRLRYEVKNNAGFEPNDDFIRNGPRNDNDYLLLREKIHVGWKPCSWAQLYAEGRNSDSFYDQQVSAPYTDNCDLQQAWLQIGNAAEFPLSLRIGRQELAYGDYRFIGTSDWNNIGRSFDAVKLRLADSTFGADAFAGRVVIPYDDHFNTHNDYDWLFGVYASSPTLLPIQDTDFYFLSRNIRSGSPDAIAPGVGGPSPRDVYTVGLRFKSHTNALSGWDYTFEAAGQFGSVNQEGRRLANRTLAVTGNIGHTWENAWGTPRLAGGYDFSPGDQDPNDELNQTFLLLFGNNHRHYGLMDVIGLRNLNSPWLKGEIQLAPWFALTAEYHLFWLETSHDYFFPETSSGRDANGYGRNPGYPRFAGSELDLVAVCTVKNWGDLQLGGGHFFVGDYIRQSVNSVPDNGGAVDANWVYVQARFDF